MKTNELAGRSLDAGRDDSMRGALACAMDRYRVGAFDANELLIFFDDIAGTRMAVTDFDAAKIEGIPGLFRVTLGGGL